MDMNKKLYLVGKEAEEGIAYARASVNTNEGEVEAVVLFENAYDAYTFVNENFNEEEDMIIYQTTIGAIEELESSTTFILMQESDEAREHMMEEENKEVVYS